MSEGIVENEVITNEQGEPQRQLNAEEQEALARYRESQKSEAERNQGVPEGYNEDGTPQEELIGGKFKSQEDLLKAYQELEKKQSQPKEETQKVTEETPQEVTAPNGKQVDVTKYDQEYVQNGSLSEASYKELEAVGFTKEMVDRYIEGQKAYANNFANDIYNTVGGQEQYSQVVQWASENMDRDFIDSYNKALTSQNTAEAKRNLEYMQYKMSQSVPKETRRIEGDSGGVGMQPFTDKNEWQKAATNRLYGKDAKYTQMVDARYLASRKRGIL